MDAGPISTSVTESARVVCCLLALCVLSSGLYNTGGDQAGSSSVKQLVYIVESR